MQSKLFPAWQSYRLSQKITKHIVQITWSLTWSSITRQLTLVHFLTRLWFSFDWARESAPCPALSQLFEEEDTANIVSVFLVHRHSMLQHSVQQRHECTTCCTRIYSQTKGTPSLVYVTNHQPDHSLLLTHSSETQNVDQSFWPSDKLELRAAMVMLAQSLHILKKTPCSLTQCKCTG